MPLMSRFFAVCCVEKRWELFKKYRITVNPNRAELGFFHGFGVVAARMVVCQKAEAGLFIVKLKDLSSIVLP